MANTYFRFKQFRIEQDRCALKVCTDACIFGAFTASRVAADSSIKKVLDIGTGTGLLSLMLAQECTKAEIHAVELDEAAAGQAAANFKQSPWPERLKILQGDVRTLPFPHLYDLVISNPPFYERDLKSGDPRKDQAKHAVTLSHEALLEAALQWLSPDGLFAVLLPYDRFAAFKALADQKGLYPAQLLEIKQTPRHAFFRTVALFSSKQTPVHTEKLTIHGKENQYTEAFVGLLQPYYLAL